MGNSDSKPLSEEEQKKIEHRASRRSVFDYVVTSIDVIETGDVEGDEYGEGAKYVEFDGKIKAVKGDTDIAYLLDVRSKESSTEFTAISVSKETFATKIAAEGKKVLACVHGFQVEPEYWLDDCGLIQGSDYFDHLVLPVIWPSGGKNMLLYDAEQAITLQAGKALSSVSEIGKYVSISVMCHSMGNRVLMSYAQSSEVSQSFDAIFMVAADVWEEVFNRRVIEDVWCQPPWNYSNTFKDSGLKLCNMLKDGCKIHIIHYRWDLALMGSVFENRRRRLGRYGKEGQKNRIDDRCYDKLISVNLDRFRDEVKELDSSFRHNYHDMPRLIKYYDSILSSPTSVKKDVNWEQFEDEYKPKSLV